MSNTILLPPLVLMENYKNDWHCYLDALYTFFCQDFIISQPNFENRRFALKRHPLTQGKEATFWHIISEGEVENERLPNLRRCERIRWPRPIIEAIHSGHIKLWKNRRKQEERFILALADFRYIVVLADRGEYVLLWTAYWVEEKHRQEKLRREYEEFISRNG